jgi:hypothetical protein
MSYGLDYFKRLEHPYIYIADANKNIIGTIQARELQSDMCFNNISTVSFKVYKYEDRLETANYNYIELMRLVEVTYLGWFQITKADKVGNGTDYEYIEIEASSLENEATTKTLTSFGQLGTDDDEQGGLDRYRLYSIADPDHSILHIWQKKLPSWSIGYVDPMITQEYRTFTNDEVGAYSFLVEEVSKTFECIFQFDTYNQTVNAYKLENIGQVTSIYLSYRNLLKSVKISANFSDIKTVYTVAGGDDNGSTLGIIEVNPSGNNQITNFSYYKSWMSAALQSKLDSYQAEYNNRQTAFNNAITTLQTYYTELNNLHNKLPSDLSSINWTEYGLDELNTKYDVYNNNMALYVGTNNSNYTSNYNLRESVNSEIKVRQLQITAKENQIDALVVLCESLVLDIHDYLGDELYKELSRYYHEDTFTDDTFVATEIMSVSEILEMKKDLLAMAQSDLTKRCKPQYQIEVDAVNFTTIPEFKEYTDQLNLGNIITLDFGDGVLVESRLLKIHMNWDSPDDFSLTFSSKNRLDGIYEQLSEIQSQSNGVTTAYNISGTGWNTAKNKTSTFSEYMSSTLDLANQKLKNSSNETFIADSTGTKWRKLINGTDNYSPNQMWGVGNGLYLTQNSWQTVSMAIGEGTYNGQSIYGIWAPLICGDLLLGQNLSIINQSGNFNINNNGFSAVYGNNTVRINPNDPNNIFSISVAGSRKFYVDVVSSRLVFNGTLDGVNGNFSGAITASTITGGTISGTTITGGAISGTTINGGTINGSNFVSTGVIGGTTLTTSINNGYITSDGFIRVITSGYVCEASANSIVLRNPSNTLLASYGEGAYLSASLTVIGNALLTNVACNTLKVNNSDVITVANRTSYTFNPSSHMHSSNDIIADVQDSAYIQFNGGRGAGYNWCLSTFELKSPSDLRLKKNVKSFDELPIELFMELKPYMYELKCKGYGNGIRFGFFSQMVESAFMKFGLNAIDYNLVEIIDSSQRTDEGEYVLDGKIHRLCYENFHAWDIYVTQFLYSVYSDLNNRVMKIEKILIPW